MLSDAAPRRRRPPTIQILPTPPNPMPKSRSSPRTCAGPAEGEARRGGRARRDHDAGPRRLELARQQRRGALYACQRDRRRQRRAARPPAGLCHRWQRRRSLCRLRNPGRAGKRDAVAEDERQATAGNSSNERVHWSRRAIPSPRSCAIRAPTPEEAKAIATTLGPRGRDGGLKEGEEAAPS